MKKEKIVTASHCVLNMLKKCEYEARCMLLIKLFGVYSTKYNKLKNISKFSKLNSRAVQQLNVSHALSYHKNKTVDNQISIAHSGNNDNEVNFEMI